MGTDGLGPEKVSKEEYSNGVTECPKVKRTKELVNAMHEVRTV